MDVVFFCDGIGFLWERLLVVKVDRLWWYLFGEFGWGLWGIFFLFNYVIFGWFVELRLKIWGFFDWVLFGWLLIDWLMMLVWCLLYMCVVIFRWIFCGVLICILGICMWKWCDWVVLRLRYCIVSVWW